MYVKSDDGTTTLRQSEVNAKTEKGLKKHRDAKLDLFWISVGNLELTIFHFHQDNFTWQSCR